jgi:hypothetical protein
VHQLAKATEMDESTSNEETTLSFTEKQKAVQNLINRLDRFEKKGFPDAHTNNQDKLWNLLIELDEELEQRGIRPSN